MDNRNPPGASGDVTALLLSWSRGDRAAAERLMPLVYRELHKLAGSYMQRERRGHTLQTTGLVHEAYMRLIDQTRVAWNSRAHFFGVAAQMMRRVLVDYARRRQALRRGGDAPVVSLSDVNGGEGALGEAVAADILEVDQALRDLATIDREKSQLVELRYFGGLSNAELAEVMGISEATLARKWRLARAWLYQYLRADGDGGEGEGEDDGDGDGDGDGGASDAGARTGDGGR